MPEWKNFDLFNPTQEHKMIRQTIRSFVENEVEPQADEYNCKEQFNIELFRKVGQLGFLGLTVPLDFGGAGMDAIAAVIVHEELSKSDPGFCLAYLAHSMLCVNNIFINANDEQRRYFLPKLCNGEWIGSMAMSEPSVGTDVLNMATTASKENNIYVLNGQKMWITNGSIDENRRPCDVSLVYAKTKNQQLSTFLIEKNMKGFSVGQKIYNKLGMRSSNTAELVFEECRVPESHLLGQEGEALTHMMRNLEIERIALASQSLGIALRSLDIMTKYANQRKAFGKPLSHFGQIQNYIANSFAELQSIRTYVYETARKIDLQKGGQRLHSDGVKLVATTTAKNIADRAIQVLGGYGYVGEYVVERLWRDAKLLEIGGGTLEAHQKNITHDLCKKLI